MKRRANLVLVIVAMLGLSVLCGSALAVDGNEPIAHWKFDEGSGTIAYDSAGSNDGTVYGALWTTGQIDGALSFDGFDDYVDCGNDSSLDITDSITVGAWVKRPNFETGSVIAGKTNGNSVTAGYGLFSYTEGLEFAFYSGGWRRTTPRVTIPANEWHYVAATFDGNNAYLYVDGEQSASLGYAGAITAATGYSFHISFWRSGIPSYFDGVIDDVRIYDRALSAEEIWQLYQEVGLAELVGLEITGPNEVVENLETQYTAIAHYNNNVTRDVTGSAQWSVEPDTYAGIDDNGLLHTESVDATEDVTIHAEYTEGNITFRVEKMVKILDHCPLPPKPVNPDPCDGATDVMVDTSLRWNTGRPPLVTTIITFDEVPEETIVDGTVIGEVTFSFSPSNDATIGSYGPGDTMFNKAPNIEGDSSGTLTLDFAVPVYEVSYGFVLSGSQPQIGATSMTFFDASMNPVLTVSADADDMGFRFVEGMNSGTGMSPITRAVIVFSHPEASRFALDNLTYSFSSGGLLSVPTATDKSSAGKPDTTQSPEPSGIGDAVGPWEKFEVSGSVLTESQQNYPSSYTNQQTRLPVTSSRIVSSHTATSSGTTIFEDDMESGPNGWTHYLISSGRFVSDNWRLSTARSASGTTSWYSGLTADGEGDTALESPNIDLTTVTTATLTFNHWYHFDDCDESDFDPDGGIVEVRVLPGSGWTQIFPTGGYPGILDVVCGPNPLEGLPAYTHNSGGVFVPAEFDLTPFVGRVIRIRFHVGWDCGNCDIEEGWYIDDVVVTGPSMPVTYDVYLGMEDPPTELIASDLNEPMCYAGELGCNTTYYWQVVAKNYCSQTEGPVWSFTTISCPALVQVTIDEKLKLLERIDAAVGREQMVHEALEEWLKSGDYGDLNKGDIVTAKQKIHSAIQHEEQSMDALEKSIEKLEDSLSVLGYEVAPNGSNN